MCIPIICLILFIQYVVLFVILNDNDVDDAFKFKIECLLFIIPLGMYLLILRNSTISIVKYLKKFKSAFDKLPRGNYFSGDLF